MPELHASMLVRTVLWVACDRLADDGIVGGRGDLAIRPSPRATYERLRERIPSDPPPSWRVADLRRCQQTASRLAPTAAWETTHDWSARDFGDWDGRTWSEVRRVDPVRAESFWRNEDNDRPPGGETFREVLDRTEAAMQTLNNDTSWASLVLVVPPEIIRAAVCVVLDIRPRNAARVRVDPLSLTVLSHSWLGWQLESLNLLP